MKKCIMTLILCAITLGTFAQVNTNSFRLTSPFGDLEQRRFADGDTNWKRSLVVVGNAFSRSSTLNINYDGDYDGGVRVQGPGTSFDNKVGIGTIPQDDFEIGTKGLSFHDGGNQVIGFKYRPNGAVDTDPSKYGAAIRFDPVAGEFSLGVTPTVSTANPTRILVVNESGKVGIRTANPDAELTVNGEIHAKEVKVDLNIPADYVFEKYYNGNSSLKADYTMPTLEEVAKYTKENHHLPEVPSAKEIQENGLELGDMTNILLQKIEELTLYTIEQEKRIQRLEKGSKIKE